MPNWARILGAIAALALVYYVAVFAAEASEGSGFALDALIAEWSGRYGVDPKAVQAVIHQEQGSVSPPSGGTWPIGDSGTSFGPMQVHKGMGASPNPGAIDDWEQTAGSIADANGSYNYLAAVDNQLAMHIGVWNLNRCINSAGGISALAFTKHNAGLGASTPNDYGTAAFDYYVGLGGSQGNVSDASNTPDSGGDAAA